MKVLCLSVFIFFSLVITLTNADYPYPPDTPQSNRPPTTIKFDAGAYVIDMGDYQTEDTTIMTETVPEYYTNFNGAGVGCGTDNSVVQHVNASTAGLFNMYAYGLVVRLLYAKVPVYWAVTAGKTSQDTYDIPSTSAQRVFPTRAPKNVDWGGSLNAVGNYSFRNGPFIIRAADVPAATAVLTAMKSAYAGQGRFESVVIYKLNSAVTVDVRHTLTFKPFIYVSTLSTNWCTWSALALVLLNAGLTNGTHFSLILEDNQLTSFSSQTCGTIFMEPHFVFDKTSCPACSSTPQYYGPLTNFIKSGGNFWVQCAGITSYENSLWQSQYQPPAQNKLSQQGAFLSKYGVQGLGLFHATINNVDVNAWQGGINSPNLVYMNYDLPISQFRGTIINLSGTVMSFYLRNDPTPATTDDSLLWANNGYGIVKHSVTDKSTWSSLSSAQGNSGPCYGCCNGTKCGYDNTIAGDGRSAYIVAGARLSSYSTDTIYVGGNVWYYATHTLYFDFARQNKDSTFPSGYTETADLYNGRRILMNSVLTPAVRPAACNLNFCSQTVDCKNQYGSCYDCVLGQCVFVAPTTCGTAGYDRSTCLCNSPSPSISTSTSRSLSVTTSASLTSTRTPSVSGTSSISVSSSSSASRTSSSTPSVSMGASTTNTASATLSASSTPSTSVSSSRSVSTTSSASATPSTTISLSSAPSQSNGASTTSSASSTPSTSVSPSRSVSATSSATASKSLPASQSNGASTTSSASSTPSASVSSSRSVSATSSGKPSSSPSSSSSSSSSPSSSGSSSFTPSPSTNVTVIAAGGGGSNAGVIAGAVVGSVVGVAAIAGLAAAGAAAAVVAYRKIKPAPMDTGAFSTSSAFNDVKQNDLFVDKHKGCDNVLYSGQ